MLTSNEKRQLKRLAAGLTIKYQLGKNQINDNVIDLFEKAIVSHELIKIDVMKNVSTSIMSLALDLSSKLNADVVQVVGRVIVLYRRNNKNPKIRLAK